MYNLRNTILYLLIALALVACGRNRDAAPEAPSQPAEPAATAPAAPADNDADQPESPLEQPESPLPSAAESPLPTPEPAEAPATDAQQSDASGGGEYNFLSDFDAITALAESMVPGEPEPGLASLSGVLYSYGTGTIVPGTVFYLTPAVETDDGLVPPVMYSGPDEETGDVPGTTGSDGEIELTTIPPGSYYLVVWTVYSWLLAEEGEGLDSPLLITVEEGEQLDLDVVFVNWP